MKKNIWRKQKGLTLLELLVAFAIFAIFIPAFITFARTAISNNSSIQNQTVATSQLKNAFNYITQDGQMAGLVIVNPAVPPAPANCVLKLQWINYPSDTIEVDYTLLNGVLTRIYTDFLNSAKNGSMIVATNVNPDTAKTYFTWSGTSLTVNLTVTIGNANEVRQFGVTPRVTQSSAQLADTLTLAAPNPSPASFGSTVTLTANFNLSSVKSGTVTFLDSNSAIPIGTAPVLTGGTATCTVSTLSVGNHTISAVFSGDAEYASSTSNTQSLTINQATTSTVVQAAPSSCAIGVPVTFTVNSLPSGAAGNVTFTSNISGDSMNIVMPVSGGGAVTTFTFSSATGVHTITATYSGDIDYAGSYGTVGVTIVYPDPVLNSISPTSCSVNPGAAVSLTANGSQFVVNISQVWFGATQLTVTSWSANQLIATIPTSLLTAASFSVSVVVKTPGATNPSGAKTFKIIGTASAAMSQLTVSPTTNINPDGSTAATLIVTAIDSVGNSVPTGGATVTITRLSGTCTLSGVTDVGNGTYTATAKSMSTGLCVFVATLGGSTVNNGGGSQAQVTVAFVAGNTINVTSNKNWSALTGGTGTGGVPGPTDLVIVSNAATLTVDLSALSGGAFANTVVF
jgi:prepilin-type N-terminal cleavage/methylation domain-containing protein